MSKLHITTIHLTPKQRDLLAPLLASLTASNHPGKPGAIIIQPDNTLTTAQAIAIPHEIAASIQAQVNQLRTQEKSNDN